MKKIRFTNFDTKKLYRFPDKGRVPARDGAKPAHGLPVLISRKCCSRRIIFASGAALGTIKRLKEVKIKFVLNRQ